VTVRMDELSWTDIRDILKKTHVVILPMGSTEEHGGHLPLNVDSYVATYVAERAAEKVMAEGDITVMVAPTMHYTDIAVHRMFPGTIGIKPDTQVKVICEIISSFLEQGFKNIIVLTAHHENNPPVEMALGMINEEHPKAKVFGVTTMGLAFDVRPTLVKAGLPGMGHALELETSLTMLLQPHLVHMEKVIKGSRRLPLTPRYIGATGSDKTKGIVYRPEPPGFESSGTFGDPTMASKEEGEKAVNSMINDFTDIIKQVAKFEF
jgi:creatinine amidohydrolase